MAYDKLSVIYFSKQLSTNGTTLLGDKWLKETLCSSERRHWTEFLGFPFEFLVSNMSAATGAELLQPFQ